MIDAVITNRLKEELIRELVKTGKTTKQLNSTYLTKIQSLERVSGSHNLL